MALALLAGGVAAVTFASLTNPAALHFVPAMDGCLTVGCVAFLLALLAGVPYRQALGFIVPLVGVQVVATQVHGASVFAVFGIEAMVIGLVGTAMGLLSRPTAPAPKKVARIHDKPALVVRGRAHPAHAV
ncbi:MAG: hypothetical protein U0359_00850 [Byssovorax sp.]